MALRARRNRDSRSEVIKHQSTPDVDSEVSRRGYLSIGEPSEFSGGIKLNESSKSKTLVLTLGCLEDEGGLPTRQVIYTQRQASVVPMGT